MDQEIQNTINANYKYFREILPELLKDHLYQFVVIKDLKPLAFYNDFSTAMIETRKNHQIGTFIVQYISDKKEDNAATFVNPWVKFA